MNNDILQIINELIIKNQKLEERISYLENQRTESPRELEIKYQRYLEKKYNASHKKNAFGISDIETNDVVIEIKNWKKYKHSIGQLQCYNHHNNKQMIAYFFGSKPLNLNNILKQFHKHNISVFHIYEVDNEISEQKLEYFTINQNKDFTKWLSKNIIHTHGEVLKLSDVCDKYLGKKTNSRTLAKYKVFIEDFIKINFPNEKNLYQHSYYNNIQYKGWLHFSL